MGKGVAVPADDASMDDADDYDFDSHLTLIPDSIDVEDGIPVQGSTRGDVDPKPRGTQRHPEEPRVTQSNPPEARARGTQKHEPESARNSGGVIQPKRT